MFVEVGIPLSLLPDCSRTAEPLLLPPSPPWVVSSNFEARQSLLPCICFPQENFVTAMRRITKTKVVPVEGPRCKGLRVGKSLAC